ncbi:MAG: PduL/EutD family phosphate acyltransferase [bacterium]|jgi:putative phosphotransacetylase|nr:PduL/EutD family phosphate acyltransferase [bacterium]
MEIPVVVQHRHVHLSPSAVRRLFGKEQLTPDQEIDQRSQFVAKEKLAVIGPQGSFETVAVLGPERAQTQVELSASDAFAIGIKAPLRVSGDLERSATVVLRGPEGEMKTTMCTIIPIRHLHLPPEMATEHNVNQHDVVKVQLVGRPHIVIDQIVVRIHPTFKPGLHLTKDEAAASWIQTGDLVKL